MPLVKTEGIVLKRIRLGETSKILTVLTPSHGKIKLVAKGARKPGHRFGSSMEPFTVSSIVFYHREGRELETLSQCDTTRDFPEFGGDLRRLAYGSAVLELVDKVVFEQESTAEVYGLVVEAVALVAGAPHAEIPLVWWAYQLKLAAALGYRPELGRCDRCQREVAGRAVDFAPQAGGVRCGACRSGGEIRVSGGALRALQFLAGASWDEIPSLRVSRRQAGEIENLLSRFFLGQFGDSLRVKSLGILRSVRGVKSRRGRNGGFSNAHDAAGSVLG